MTPNDEAMSAVIETMQGPKSLQEKLEDYIQALKRLNEVRK
jgi:hypothetical protein